LATVVAFDFSECGKILTDFVGEAEEHTPAFLRGSCRPRSIFKSRLRGSDSAIHVIGTCIRNLRNDLFSRGIIDWKSLVRFAGDPLAVDEHLISLDFGLNSAGHDASCLLVSSLRDPIRLYFSPVFSNLPGRLSRS